MTITSTDATSASARTAVDDELSTRRLNVMRFGYAFLGVGLAIVKWPLLIRDAPSLPVMDGVVACLLTAMSLLAFLGLRYPVQMLPILLFEVAWKVLWLATVAVPHLVSDDMDAATRGGPVQLFLHHRHHRRHPVGIRLEALRQDAPGTRGVDDRTRAQAADASPPRLNHPSMPMRGTT